KRAQQEVFHPRFVRSPFTLRERDQHVERQRHQLQRDIQRNQIVTAPEEHHAHGGKQNQRVVFAVLFAFDIEVANGNRNRQRRGQEEERAKEERKSIDVHHAVETVRGRQGRQRAEAERAAHVDELRAE